VAKPSSLSLGFWEFVELLPSGPCDSANDHLSNPVSIVHGKRVISPVDEKNGKLPSIIGIDRPWRVDESNSMTHGKAAPRSHLAFKAFRNGYGNSRWNESPLTRLEDDVRIDTREEVHPRCPFRHILRQENSPIGSQTLNGNPNALHGLRDVTGSSGLEKLLVDPVAVNRPEDR